MHFCVSDHVSEWLSQIVLDKVHLRWEIEECDHRGEIRQRSAAVTFALPSSTGEQPPTPPQACHRHDR